MNNTPYKPALLPKMYCGVFGHNFKVSKKVTYHVSEYTCSHCKKQLTTSSNGALIELTPKFKEINNKKQKKKDKSLDKYEKKVKRARRSASIGQHHRKSSSFIDS